jgi:hypothetical protein
MEKKHLFHHHISTARTNQAGEYTPKEQRAI